ncbi:hypothetical protein PIB30_055273 [Stylosanthes scabra]|uniref:Uncharacterized protein n=1 Tax=Stylosanthes scabra TaxID=79078 RepID=A0ABU6TIU8_9FABA|nr:hypothetical protein [Stylosanthes scabra]
MEDLYQQLLGSVPGENDRQAEGKWVVKLSWFRDRICQGLGDDPTDERLMQYTRGYIMQIIGDVMGLCCTGIFVPTDVSGNTIWAAKPGGCISLLLSWAHHRIPACPPHGFEERRFPSAERWINYEPPRDREETRLKS